MAAAAAWGGGVECDGSTEISARQYGNHVLVLVRFSTYDIQPSRRGAVCFCDRKSAVYGSIIVGDFGQGATNVRQTTGRPCPGCDEVVSLLSPPANLLPLPKSQNGLFTLTSRVWDAGAVALAGALRSPSCRLEALGLSCTQLTDVAALAFSRVLVDGRSVDVPGEQRRSKEHNLGEAGGEQGVSGGVKRCPLRRLDLSRNSITDEGAR